MFFFHTLKCITVRRVNRQILPRRQLLPKIVVFRTFDQDFSDPTSLHLYDSSRRFYYVPAIFSSKNHLHISSEHRDISIFTSSIPNKFQFFVPFFIPVFNIHHEETQWDSKTHAHDLKLCTLDTHGKWFLTKGFWSLWKNCFHLHWFSEVWHLGIDFEKKYWTYVQVTMIFLLFPS